MVSTHREALSLFNRDVRLVLFSQALIGFTIFGGVYTVLLNLYLLRLGYGPQMIGQVNAVGALSFALLSMPAGLLANRWGARRSMIVGMIIAAFGFGLLPLGEFAPSSVQLTWIMGAYALGVLGNTFYIVCSIPFLTLICPPRCAITCSRLRWRCGRWRVLPVVCAAACCPACSPRSSDCPKTTRPPIAIHCCWPLACYLSALVLSPQHAPVRRNRPLEKGVRRLLFP